jgi:NAD(P)-dependent dehydrogenase (short-subunit alcohol dehydrogenase family)
MPTAIVTGSDSGIGRATAVALAKDGFDVGVTWHSDGDGAEATAKEIREQGRRAEVRQLDLTDLPAAADVVDELAESLGGVDVLVANSGTGSSELAVDLDFEEWRKVLSVDLDGAFLCLQRAARRMIEQGRGGRLIAVTSVHEHQPRVGSAPYDAAKGGLGLLIKTLALELGEHGITANAVAPGEIATPMTGQEDEDPRGTKRPGVPLGRPGDAREIAAVIAFLASPGAGYVTGASIAADGGMLNMGPMAGSHLTSDDWRRP